MKDQLNVALLDTKFMGWAHSNARLKVGKFLDLASVPIMYTVAGRNAADVETFAERWGWTNHTADRRTAVDDPEVDLVDVATPNCAHADQAIAALEAGKRVVCGKSLAGTFTDAEAMARSAQKAQGHTFDEAAAAMYSLQNDVLASQGIPVQGVGRESYRS